MDLLREGTEVVDAPADRPATRPNPGTNPLGMAILLFLVALPMCLLFTPIGLGLLAVSLALGLWGVVAVLVRR